jgi:hypothetical protein
LEQYQLEMDKDRLHIPLDLGEWVDRQVLMAWVKAEIDALDWANPALQSYLTEHPDFRPKALLTLLTSAYATGVFESEEMILALKNNADFKDLWRGREPAAKEIERFRRQNRALIRWVLVQVLQQAMQTRLQFADIRYLAGLRQALTDSATERLDLARHMDRAAQGA